MRHLTKTHIYTLLILSFFVSCQQKKQSEPDSLQSIGLLRGDIQLCGSGNFGEVSFSQSCNVDVWKTFDLAISLLHSFEYDEAEKAFVQVIDADPECAMAYWGIAMSNFHSLWLQSGTDYLVKGSKILKAAQPISKSEKEQDYLNAIGSFYEDWETTSHQDRVKKFEGEMSKLYEKYKDDNEAAIFYSLALTASADPADKSYKSQRRSGRILESIFPNQPNHPGIAHYIIHNYDYPELAHLALLTARRYAEIAPSSAHAQHMPSHIFTRLGLWGESINSNINSTASALCYSESIDPEGHWDEELHGMDYLVYAYLQIGENEKAMAQYDYLKTFKKIYPLNFKVAYSALAIPARIALENKDWSTAGQLQLPQFEVDWHKFPWQKSIYHYSRALGGVRSGNMELAENELEFLRDNHKQLLENKKEYEATHVMIQIKSIDAWLLFMNGDREAAIALMEEARSMEEKTTKHPVTPGEILPAGELLGDLLMEARRPQEALLAYERDLKIHPNRFNGLYGAGVAAAALSNDKKAAHYFQSLLAQISNKECKRPEVETARKYLSKVRSF